MANEFITNTVSYTTPSSGYGLTLKAHVQQILNIIPGLYIHTTTKDTSDSYDVILTRADFDFGIRLYNSTRTVYIQLIPYTVEGGFASTGTQLTSYEYMSYYGRTYKCSWVQIDENYFDIRITYSDYVLRLNIALLTSQYDGSTRYGVRVHETNDLPFSFVKDGTVCSSSSYGGSSHVNDCAPTDVIVFQPVYLYSSHLFLGNPLVGGMTVYSAANQFKGTSGKIYEVGDEKFYCMSAYASSDTAWYDYYLKL